VESIKHYRNIWLDSSKAWLLSGTGLCCTGDFYRKYITQHQVVVTESRNCRISTRTKPRSWKAKQRLAQSKPKQQKKKRNVEQQVEEPPCILPESSEIETQLRVVKKCFRVLEKKADEHDRKLRNYKEKKGVHDVELRDARDDSDLVSVNIRKLEKRIPEDEAKLQRSYERIQEKAEKIHKLETELKEEAEHGIGGADDVSMKRLERKITKHQSDIKKHQKSMQNHQINISTLEKFKTMELECDTKLRDLNEIRTKHLESDIIKELKKELFECYEDVTRKKLTLKRELTTLHDLFHEQRRHLIDITGVSEEYLYTYIPKADKLKQAQEQIRKKEERRQQEIELQQALEDEEVERERLHEQGLKLPWEYELEEEERMQKEYDNINRHAEERRQQEIELQQKLEEEKRKLKEMEDARIEKDVCWLDDVWIKILIGEIPIVVK
jgi:hypothetical protein